MATYLPERLISGGFVFWVQRWLLVWWNGCHSQHSRDGLSHLFMMIPVTCWCVPSNKLGLIVISVVVECLKKTVSLDHFVKYSISSTTSTRRDIETGIIVLGHPRHLPDLAPAKFHVVSWAKVVPQKEVLWQRWRHSTTCNCWTEWHSTCKV